MRLAREQISKGDGRLAIRALFLATLANLGEEGVIKIARFKSNRDYRKELGLKVRKRMELRRAFDQNTILFEEAWYGRHPVYDKAVDDFLKNHETITKESGAAITSLQVLKEGGVGMTGRRRGLTWAALITFGTVLLVVFMEVMERRFVEGDIYPYYASFRSDPLETSAYYETLADLPNYTVTRNAIHLNTVSGLDGDTAL